MEVPFRAEIEKQEGGLFVVKAMQKLFEQLQQQPFRVGANYIRTGAGTPEGTVAGEVGDIYLRTDSTTSFSSDPAVRASALYVKYLGARPLFGWYPMVAIPLAGLPNLQVPYSNGTPILQSDPDFTFDGVSTLNAVNLTVSSTLTTGAAVVVNAGLLFPAVQNPSSNVNTLDDYEEGTWTPAIGGTGGTSGQVYSVQSGQYVKVGQIVSCNGHITFTTLGTLTGNVQLQGLPFTTSSVTGAGEFGLANGLTTAMVSLGLEVQASGTTALLVMRTAAATNVLAVAQADLSNTTDLDFHLTYRATA